MSLKSPLGKSIKYVCMYVCISRLLKSVHFYIHTMQNIYRQFVLKKKKTETKTKKKSSKTLKSLKKGSYVLVFICAVLKVAKALYLDLRWTPL